MQPHEPTEWERDMRRREDIQNELRAIKVRQGYLPQPDGKKDQERKRAALARWRKK